MENLTKIYLYGVLTASIIIALTFIFNKKDRKKTYDKIDELFPYFSNDVKNIFLLLALCISCAKSWFFVALFIKDAINYKSRKN
jgi:hypothetical protein